MPGGEHHPTGPPCVASEPSCRRTAPEGSDPERGLPRGGVGGLQGAFCRPAWSQELQMAIRLPTATTALPASPIFCWVTPDPLRTRGFPGDHCAVGHSDLAGSPALPGHVTANGKGLPAPLSQWG